MYKMEKSYTTTVTSNGGASVVCSFISFHSVITFGTCTTVKVPEIQGGPSQHSGGRSKRMTKVQGQPRLHGNPVSKRKDGKYRDGWNGLSAGTKQALSYPPVCMLQAQHPLLPFGHSVKQWVPI